MGYVGHPGAWRVNTGLRRAMECDRVQYRGSFKDAGTKRKKTAKLADFAAFRVVFIGSTEVETNGGASRIPR